LALIALQTFEHRGIASAVTGHRVWPRLIAFHRPGARGGAEVRCEARSPIAFDLSVRRKDVRRSREVVAGETRWSLGGGEVGGRTTVRNWGKDVGYQNVTLWVPNIGTITSFREGFGGKSPLS